MAKTITQKDIVRLSKLAFKAYEANYKFERLLEAAKATPGWAEACDAAGIVPDATPREWCN
jgi:hypothetical protein